MNTLTRRKTMTLQQQIDKLNAKVDAMLDALDRVYDIPRDLEVDEYVRRSKAEFKKLKK